MLSNATLQRELLAQQESLERLRKSLADRELDASKIREESNKTEYEPKFGAKTFDYDNFIPSARKFSSAKTVAPPSSLYSSYCYSDTFKNSFNPEINLENSFITNLAPNSVTKDDLILNLFCETSKTGIDKKLGPGLENLMIIPMLDSSQQNLDSQSQSELSLVQNFKQKTLSKLNSVLSGLASLDQRPKKSFGQKGASTTQSAEDEAETKKVLGRSLRKMMPVFPANQIPQIDSQHIHLDDFNRTARNNTFYIRMSRFIKNRNGFGSQITIRKGFKIPVSKYLATKNQLFADILANTAAGSQIGRLQLYKSPIDWRIVKGGTVADAFALEQAYTSSLLLSNLKFFRASFIAPTFSVPPKNANSSKLSRKNKQNFKKVKNLNRKPNFLLTNRERKVSRIFAVVDHERTCDIKKEEKIFNLTFGNGNNSSNVSIPSKNPEEISNNSEKTQENPEKNQNSNNPSSGSSNNGDNENNDGKDDPKAQKNDKKKKKKKNNRMNAKHKKQLGLDIKPLKKTKLDYKQFKPLNELWTQYMENLLNLQQTSCEKAVQTKTTLKDNNFFSPIPSLSASSLVPPSMYETILKIDLHGCLIKIVASKIPSYIGIEGIIIQETENAMMVISEKKKVCDEKAMKTKEEIEEERIKKEKQEREQKMLAELDVWGTSAAKKRKKEEKGKEKEKEDCEKNEKNSSIVRCVLKEGTVFAFQFGNQVFTLFGDHLKYRSFERCAKKFKQKYQHPFLL